MRGLMRAAGWWFLAPALTTAVVAAGTSDAAALIQLGIPDVDTTTYRDASLLRLDVLESAEPCGYGNVTLNDQTLDQDGHGRGSGSLVLEEGSTFMARWNFSCVDAGDGAEPEQLMEVAVDLVDGTAVTGLNFAVRFQQTTPIRVLSVDGVPAVVTTPRRPAADQLDDESEAAELRRLRAELDHMIQQKVALEKAILEKQHSVVTQVGECHVKASTKLRKCHSPRCLVSTMYHKIKTAAGIESLYSCSTKVADEPPIRIAFPDKDKERPLVAISDESHPQPQNVQYESHPQPQNVQYDSQAQMSHSDPSEAKWRRIKLCLLFLPAGVVVLALAVVLGVKHAAAHSAAAAPEDAEGQTRRRTRRAARRQAQAERRAALQAGFEELKRRLRERFAPRHRSIEDEEKDAIMRRVHAGHDGHDDHGPGGGGGDDVGHGGGNGGDDSGSESDSDASSTTMEQELASFRNLADVVGSMVSSSSLSSSVHAERRPRPPAIPIPRPPSPKNHQQQQQPRRPGYAFSDCGSVDEELPSYDEGVIGASHVADGFRYWPGHPAAPPAASSPLDDVLGVKD